MRVCAHGGACCTPGCPAVLPVLVQMPVLVVVTVLVLVLVLVLTLLLCGCCWLPAAACWAAAVHGCSCCCVTAALLPVEACAEALASARRRCRLVMADGLRPMSDAWIYAEPWLSGCRALSGGCRALSGLCRASVG